MATVEAHWYPDPLVVADELDAMAMRLESDNTPMHEALISVIGSIDRTFDAQDFAPWSLEYALSRGKPHGPLADQGLILDRTGEMRGASLSPSNYDVGIDSIEWTGASVPFYTSFHLDGTSKMPQRNFLRVDEEAAQEIGDIFEAWMANLAEGVHGGPTIPSAPTFAGSFGFGGTAVFRGAGGRFVSVK